MKQDQYNNECMKIIFLECGKTFKWNFKKILTTNRGRVKECWFCAKDIIPGEYRYVNSGINICISCAQANQVSE